MNVQQLKRVFAGMLYALAAYMLYKASPAEPARAGTVRPRAPRCTIRVIVHLDHHPESSVIRLQLKQNVVIKGLSADDFAELVPMLDIVECGKRATLVEQGVREMGQYFILDGVLKRVVSNKPRRAR